MNPSDYHRKFHELALKIDQLIEAELSELPDGIEIIPVSKEQIDSGEIQFPAGKYIGFGLIFDSAKFGYLHTEAHSEVVG